VGSGSSPLSWSFPPTAALTSFPAPDCWLVLLLLLVPCLFTAHVGGGSSPLSCGVFLPPSLSQAFLLLVAERKPPLPPEPLWPGLACLFTVPGRIPLPRSSELRAPHPLCNVSLLFLLLITQFLFFPGWRSVCPGGYADLAQGCLWEYHVPLSSPCPHLPKPSGRG
jgi:hypothetical protein